ncbi:MAG: hypothetical protein CME64_01070 [Halobacteriovoraceae bacterium]|nr:hypothetical protein [Halobacteriovoraceae bacterium]|tara:strand:- start:230044 stop:231036 length:993 start_codon:yes stop_codon:yes gene_type:complete
MISIVVPMVQVTDCLRENLKRLQNHPKVLEVILVDNAKKDLRSCLPLSSKIKNIKSDLSKNRSYARNLGASIAKGDAILFVDQEVHVPTEFLEEAECLSPAGFDVVVPRIRPTFSREGIAQKLYFKKYAQVTRGSFCTLSRFDLALPNLDSACFMVRKIFFESTGGFDPKFIRFEDRHWGRVAILNGAKFKCVPIFCEKDIQDLNLVSYHFKNYLDAFFRSLSNRLIRVSKNFKKEILYPVSWKNSDFYSFQLGPDQFKCTGSLSFIYNDGKIKIVNAQNLRFTVLSKAESNEFMLPGSKNSYLILNIAKKLKSIGISIEKRRGLSERSS